MEGRPEGSAPNISKVFWPLGDILNTSPHPPPPPPPKKDFFFKVILEIPEENLEFQKNLEEWYLCKQCRHLHHLVLKNYPNYIFFLQV